MNTWIAASSTDTPTNNIQFIIDTILTYLLRFIVLSEIIQLPQHGLRLGHGDIKDETKPRSFFPSKILEHATEQTQMSNEHFPYLSHSTREWVF
jgi:hypothetical protein